MAGIVTGATVVYQTVRSSRARDPAALLADALGVLRAAAAACRSDLDVGTARLAVYDAQLDSLHGRVRAFEALDPRGVPADSYEVYLDAFHQYNDSAAGWSARADTLRARLASCRAVTERHNLLADSLRRLLIQQP
jgi:hypothetical protein